MAIDREYARKLGDTLKYYRERAGKSREFVAERLGYSHVNSIVHAEEGRSYPQIHHLHALATLYGVTTDTLLNLYVPPTRVAVWEDRCGYTDARQRRCTDQWGHDGYHVFAPATSKEEAA